MDRLFRKYGNTHTARVLDDIKNLGFRFATRSGTTVGITDVTIPPEKKKIVADAEKQVELVEQQHRRGLLTSEERYQRICDIWTKAKEEITAKMIEGLDNFNPVYMMATSGARGNESQLSQLAGMRGLVTDPTGKTIEIPIKGNFREGLTVLEYFISTHGTRKGLADTALRTADSGYLTRRLVDVSGRHRREHDCGTEDGIMITAERGQRRRGRDHRTLAGAFGGPVAAETVRHPRQERSRRTQSAHR